MLIIDGDYPMSYGAIDMDRDLTMSVDELRKAPAGHVGAAHREGNDQGMMACIPEMRKGKVAVALVKVVGRVWRPGSTIWGFRTDENAYAQAQAHLAWYRYMSEIGELRVLATTSDFSDHMKEWSDATDHGDLPVGVVIGMEGADPIVNSDQAQEWWDAGLRVVSLSHYGPSRYSHGTGTGTDGGLFPPARPLLEEMERLGIILDITHTSDESVRQAVEIYGGPLLASHQNCRAIVPGERQFPDHQLTWIIERGGVIGCSMDTWMLYTGGLDWANITSRRDSFAREDVTLEDYANHIDYICQLAGSSHHAAIGGDTDGQGGVDGAPYEIDTVADYQKVAEVLDRRGYKTEDVENVMYRNWQRFYEKHLPAA